MLTPGSNANAESGVDIQVCHRVHGHSNELLLRETAKSLGVKLVGRLRPCARCSVTKGCRKPIPHSTHSRATEILERVFFYLNGPERMASLLGKRYVMLMKDDYSRHAWVYFLKENSDSEDVFRSFFC